jgi:hypothetical protein
MREADFEVLAKYYADLELFEAAVSRNDPEVGIYAGKAKDHDRPALRAVEGYCNALWQPFSYRPGPLRDGGFLSGIPAPPPPREWPKY